MIKISISNFMAQTDTTKIIAQNQTYLICEVASTDYLTCEFEMVSDIPAGYEQRVHEGRFGTYMTLAQIRRVSQWKSKLTQDEIDRCQTVGELELMARNKDLQEAMDTLTLDILEQRGV